MISDAAKISVMQTALSNSGVREYRTIWRVIPRQVLIEIFDGVTEILLESMEISRYRFEEDYLRIWPYHIESAIYRYWRWCEGYSVNEDNRSAVLAPLYAYMEFLNDLESMTAHRPVPFFTPREETLDDWENLLYTMVYAPMSAGAADRIQWLIGIDEPDQAVAVLDEWEDRGGGFVNLVDIIQRPVR